MESVWRAKISPWSKTVGFSGAVEFKKELGYSSKAKIVVAEDSVSVAIAFNNRLHGLVNV